MRGSGAIALCSRGSSRKLGPLNSKLTSEVKEEKEVMANLSSDLNSYLSRSTSSSSINSVTSKLSAFKLPTLNTIKSFGGGGGQQEDEEPFLGVQVVYLKNLEYNILSFNFFRLMMEAVAVVGLKAGLPERQMSGCQA